jgi:hypothetical protein
MLKLEFKIERGLHQSENCGSMENDCLQFQNCFKMENLSSSYLQVFYKNEMLKMVDPIVTITWEYLDL